MEITKIVITGGPCGGKSSALRRVKEYFTEKGYTVLAVAETATELIGSGVAPWTCGSREEYQCCQIRLQSVKEEVYDRAARSLPKDKILIVFDRAVFDCRAYMGRERFSRALAALGIDESEALLGYGAVFHLVTAAKGAEAFYTTSNNAARVEAIGEAAMLDSRTEDAWSDHPHHRVIDNSTDFEGKIARLLSAIETFLSENKKAESSVCALL